MILRETREFKEAVELEKHYLIEIFTDKFEEYKHMITSKFSDFLDIVLDEELNIPEDEQLAEILLEAKNEIISLRNEVNKLTGGNLDLIEQNRELFSDACELATEIRDHRNNIKVNVELTNDEEQAWFDIQKYFDK